MNAHWPPPRTVIQRGAIAALVLILMMLVLLLTQAHAAGIVGRYVQLLAVTNDGRVSVVHDLTETECRQVVATLAPHLGRTNPADFRELSCLPIDYNKENKRR